MLQIKAMEQDEYLNTFTSDHKFMEEQRLIYEQFEKSKSGGESSAASKEKTDMLSLEGTDSSKSGASVNLQGSLSKGSVESEAKEKSLLNKLN